MALVCFVPARARGDSAARLAAARRWFVVGAAEVSRARWAEALPAFNASYRLRPHVVTEFNIAACHRALGRYAAARRWYARLLHDRELGRYPQLAAEARERDEELASLSSRAEIPTVTSGAGVAWPERCPGPPGARAKNHITNCNHL